MGKIKRLKYYIALFGVTAMFSLTGCSKHENKTETGETSISIATKMESDTNQLMKEMQLEETLTKEQLRNLVIDLNCSDDTLLIQVSDLDDNSKELKVFSYSSFGLEKKDDYYKKINLLLRNSNITSLTIENMGKELDFSKIDLTNIKHLTLEECTEKFNYECFIGKSWDSITLNDIPISVVRQMIDNQNNTIMNLRLNDFNNDRNEIMKVINIMVEKGISLNSTDIWISNVTSPEYQQMCNLKTKELTIDNHFIFINYDDEAISSIDFDIEVNPAIENLSFYTTIPNSSIEYGNIEIISSNPKLTIFLHCGEDGGTVTKNTNILVPDHARLYLECCGIEDYNFLYGLSNTDLLLISGYSDTGNILYSKDTDNFYNTIQEVENFTKNEKAKGLQKK